MGFKVYGSEVKVLGFGSGLKELGFGVYQGVRVWIYNSGVIKSLRLRILAFVLWFQVFGCIEG